ncbi:MAG: hypothetical protein QXR84_03435 [Candidatus Bathyarchaeia archaeon]|nr:hypothetical protein [Candidatus Bathyarchaeota archaeon]
MLVGFVGLGRESTSWRTAAYYYYLSALVLSVSRVTKYANLLCMLVRNCPFDPTMADRRMIERVIV